jgi:hypothetical protein
MLTQVRNTTDPNFECEMLLRGRMPSSSSVSFTRGAGTVDAGCETTAVEQVVWERIDFGSRGNVQVATASFAAGASTANLPISAVDLTRTIVFTSSQIVSGPGAGEMASNGELTDAMVRLELNTSTNVRVTRTDDDGPAVVTVYVVEIEP